MSARFHERGDEGQWSLLPSMPILRVSPDDSVGAQTTFKTFKAQLLTRYGASMQLYQAYAVTEDENGKKRFTFKPSGIILYKVASGEEATKKLQIEVGLYCGELKRLQGKFIPMFHGYFQGKRTDGTVVGCMVVESVGKTRAGHLEPEGDHVTRKLIKQAMVDALLAIHKAGVQYGDNLQRMLITRDPTKPENLRIADFSSATTGHIDCQRLGLVDSSYIAHTATTENLDIECCPELFNFCQRINFWAPPRIVYGQDNFPIDPEFNVSKLVQRARPSMTQRWQKAFQCYIDYTNVWGPEKRRQELLEERAEWEKQEAAAKSDDVETGLPYGTLEPYDA